MKLENDAKFEEKLTCGLENDIRMRIYVSLQWRMMQTLNGNWLVVSKLTWGIWRIFTRAFKSFINLHFNGFLLNKVCNVWSKKVQRIYFSWYWRVMGNLKKKWLKFGKWHEEFEKVLLEHWKVSKLWVWWDPFIQK